MSSQHAAPIHDADASAPDRLLAPALEAVRAGALLALDPGEELRIDTKRDRNDDGRCPVQASWREATS